MAFHEKTENGETEKARTIGQKGSKTAENKLKCVNFDPQKPWILFYLKTEYFHACLHAETKMHTFWPSLKSVKIL